MEGGYIRNNICTDTLTSTGKGGGVYNEGNFIMIEGSIYDNVASKGERIYNVGVFEEYDGWTDYNNALGGVDDVFIKNSCVHKFIFYPIGVVAVVAVIAGLLVYRSKSQKPSVVNK